MDVLEAIRKRRSIRFFKDREISDDIIFSVLEAGLWAPSAGNVQDKEFIIVRDDENIHKFADACYEQNWVAKAPVIIVLISKVNLLRMKFGERAELYASLSAGMTVQNMLLSLTGHGLQGTHVGLFDEEEVKRILKIPDDKKVYSVIALGYSREKTVVPKRINLKTITFFDKYDSKWVKNVPRKTY